MQTITTAELVRDLESGTPLEVVDIREAHDYEGWHIHGSRNVPVYDALKRGMSQPLVDRAASLASGRPIVTVCRAGHTSVRAAQILESLGFRSMSLEGGMRGWSGAWTEARIPLDADGALIQVRRNGKGCLSYLLGSRGEAAVIDPCVDAGAYIGIAKREGLKITQVFETHVHADHLSRGRDLAERTGAALLLPENRRVTFAFTTLRDGQSVPLGAVALEVIATPGHTDESVCYGLPGGVLLTGDTLFVGSVGRPDLEKGDAGADAGAHLLYHSLKDRVFAPGRDGRFYPGHESRAIGFDGVPIGSTLAESRASLALLRLDEASFVAAVMKSLTAKPPNFERIVAINEGKAGLLAADPLDLEAGPNRCAAG